MELTVDEEMEAWKRWREFKFLVCNDVDVEEQSLAIIRLIGEEDVHGIATAEDAENEIS